MDATFIPISLSISNGENDCKLRLLSDITQHPSVSSICEELRKEYEVQIEIFGQVSLQNGVININGTTSAVISAKTAFLHRFQPLKFAKIDACAADIFSLETKQLRNEVKQKFDDIMENTSCNISCTTKTADVLSGFLIAQDSADDSTISIEGCLENVESAKIQTLAFLDSIHGLCVRGVTVDTKTLPSLCGRRLHHTNTISKDTKTKIYIPFIFTSDIKVKVFIVGDEPDAKAAEELLIKRSQSIQPKLIQKKITISTDKLAYICSVKKWELAKIMQDFGTFVALEISPSSELSVAVFVSEHEASIEKTVHNLISLSADMHVLCLNLSTGLVAELSRLNISRAGFLKRFSTISATSNASINVVSQKIVLYGTPLSIMSASKSIKEIEEIKKITIDIRIHTHMASAYEEFITGKKNGKINKIVKSANVQINFIEKNDKVITLETVSVSFENLFSAFKQLLDELPAELEFFVADQHHKRIIGVAGKNIQSIMKIYGVYVKFMNSDEFRSLGGQIAGDTNVIARTPAKNAENLHELHLSVLEQIDPEIRSRVKDTIIIPRRYHLYLKKILEAPSEEIIFPLPSSGQNQILIEGNEEIIRKRSNDILFKIPLKYCVSQLYIPNQNGLWTLAEFKKEITYLENNTSFTFIKAENGVVIEGKRSSLDKVSQISTRLSPFFATPVVTASVGPISSDPHVPQSFSSLSLREAAHNDSLLESRVSDSAPDLNSTEVDGRQVEIKNAPIGAQKSDSFSAINNKFNDQLVSGKSSFSGSGFESSIVSQSNLTYEADKKPHNILKISTSREFHPESQELQSLSDNPLSSSVIKNILPRESDNSIHFEFLNDNISNTGLLSLLNSLDLGKFCHVLAENDVDYEMFLKLTEEDFKELGATIGMRKKLIGAINEINKTRSSELSKHPKASSVGNSPSSFGKKWKGVPSEWPKGNIFSTPYSYRSSETIKNGQLSTITSPLSPSQMIGFIDFIPGSTPLPSPVPNYPESPIRAKLFGSEMKSPSADNAMIINDKGDISENQTVQEKDHSFFSFSI